MASSDDRKGDEFDEEQTSTRRKIVDWLLKKGLESGMGAVSKGEDAVRGVIEGLKLPKDMATLALEQIDETKNGIYRAVAKEIRDFLENTNFDTEMKKILTGLAFEVKMEVRFKDAQQPDGTSSLRPDITADVGIKDRVDKKPKKKEA